MESPMVKEKDESPVQRPPLTLLAAINGSRKSAHAVVSALVKHKEERVLLRLLHVCPTIKAVPTPMGNLPISDVRPDVVAAYRKDVECEINRMFLPFERLDTKGKVEIEVMVVEADDVPEAIARVVSTFKIRKLVIGESSHSWLKRVFKAESLSSRICQCVPSFCSVYVVSKGKVTERPPTSDVDGSIENTRDDDAGIPRFQPTSSIIKYPPVSRSNSSSSSYSISAFMDAKDKDALRSMSHNSNGPDIAERRTHSSRSSRSDWKYSMNYDPTSHASPIASSSSSERHSVAAPSPGIRLKETKH